MGILIQTIASNCFYSFFPPLILGDSPCSFMNGGCSHSCVADPADASCPVCSCPSGLTLSGNGRSCMEPSVKFLEYLRYFGEHHLHHEATLHHFVDFDKELPRWG